MGLISQSLIAQTKEFSLSMEFNEAKEHEFKLASWSEHNRLHEWMCELWVQKSKKCKKAKKNLGSLRLTLEDILKLEVVLLNRELPKSTRLDWGEDSYLVKSGNGMYFYEANDLNAIKLAKKHLKLGHILIYTFWY